jgi:hypothetical protein
MPSRAGGVVVSELRSALDGLAAVDVAALPAAALGEHIHELLTARNRLDGEIERAARPVGGIVAGEDSPAAA